MSTRGLSGSLSLIATALLVACAGTQHPTDTLTSGDTMTITEGDIAQLVATTGWEVLKSSARRYTYTEDRLGRPLRIVAQRGVSSMVLPDSDEPMVVIDGARITDLIALADLPASAITRIDISGGIRGTGAQGTNASAGVIYIHTHEASNPQMDEIKGAD